MHRQFVIIIIIVIAFSTSLKAQDTAVSFNGIDQYAEITPITFKSGFRIVAWIGKIPQKDESVFLLSDDNSQSFVAYKRNSVHIKLPNQTVYSVKDIDFSQMRYIEVDVRTGMITVSNGLTSIEKKDANINPQNTVFSQLFKYQQYYSKGALQAIGFIDRSNFSNNRTLGFKYNGSPKWITHNTEVRLVFHKMNSLNVIENLSVPHPNLRHVQTIDELEKFLKRKYPNGPMMTNDKYHGDDYAWGGHYWIRLYLHLYAQTNNQTYIDRAVLLANSMFFNTDAERYERTGVSQNDYTRAPKYLLNDRTKMAPGWKRPVQGSSVEVLIDGMILNAVMRLVDVIKSQNITQHIDVANHYMTKAIEIISSHDGSYSRTKQKSVKGSWYYVNNRNMHEGNRGLFGAPLAYNHSLTMATALVYLDKWLGGKKQYQEKINDIKYFFKSSIQKRADGTCVWNYNWTSSKRNKTRIEDINHGHIDVGFLVVAEKEGYFSDESLMRCMAKTFTENIAIGPGPTPRFVDGTSMSKPAEVISIAFDWIELSKYDSTIPSRVRNIIRQFTRMHWHRDIVANGILLTEK